MNPGVDLLMFSMTLARKLVKGLCLVLLLSAAFTVSAQIDPVDEETFANMATRWNAILDFPEQLLSDSDISPHELDPLSENVSLVKGLAQKARKEAEANLERQQKLQDALGPPPTGIEPAEAADIAEKRAMITGQLALYDARIKQSKIVIARSREILKQIGAMEISIMTAVLGKRLRSPLSPELIKSGIQQLPARVADLGDSIVSWWRSTQFIGGVSVVVPALIALVISLGIILFVHSWFVTKYGMVADIESPSQSRRYFAVLVEALAYVILPLLLIAGVTFIFVSNAQFTRELESNFRALALALIQFVLVTGLAKASLTSQKPQWRITSFTDESAANLEGAVRLFATVLLIVNLSMVLVNPSRSELGTLRILNFITVAESVILIGTVGLLLVAVFALNVFRSRNWRLYRRVEGKDEKTEQPAPFNVRLLFNLARGLIVFGAIVYLVGYLNLGLYIVTRTILTLCYIAITLLLHGLVREGLNQATSVENPIGRRIRERFALQDVGASRWVFWLVLLVDAQLTIGLILLLLLVWGVPWAEITPVFTTLVYGADLGGHTFSLISVGIALGAFILSMVVVKLLQGFLSNRILVQTRLDVGVRDAVTAGVGYVGVVVAVLVALSLMGLKFGEIALVFGALSIGIGFGLQGIVNNFISGLVLLVQRPIKAGDWIVVGQNQGYVKRVSVISTEITTFDNATVIVPNSQLMTTEVTNWTHRGRLGRVKVPVGVSYSTNPEQVQAILLKCAEENSTVLSRPAPQVRFMAFGESSLDFELRVYIRDIDYTLVVASELRFAIKKALDEAGIEIPFPQRDLHVKNLPDTARGLPAQGISD